MATLVTPPFPGEYKPYAIAYVSLVPIDRSILDVLRDAAETTEELIRSYPADGLAIPHAPGEWTIQDVLGHVADQERVLAYRLLCIARGDKSDFPASTTTNTPPPPSPTSARWMTSSPSIGVYAPPRSPSWLLFLRRF